MARKGTDTKAVEVLYSHYYTTVQIERVLNVGSGQIVKVLKRLGIPSRKKNALDVYTFLDEMTVEEKDALKAYVEIIEGLFGNVEIYPLEDRKADELLSYLKEVTDKGVDGYAEEHMYTRLGGMAIHTLYKKGFNNKLIQELSEVTEDKLEELMENYPTLWGNRRKAAILEGSGEVEGLEDLRAKMVKVPVEEVVEVNFTELPREVQREKVMALLNEGMKTLQVAKELGISAARVSRLRQNKYENKQKHNMMLAKDMICKRTSKFKKENLGKAVTTAEEEEVFKDIYSRAKKYDLTEKQLVELEQYIKDKLVR